MTRLTFLILFLAYAILLSVALGRAGHRSRMPAADDAPAPRPGRVLIIGATGGTGRELVAQALKAGFHVTAMVRDPSRLEIESPNLEVVRGDVLDPASVERAMQGQEAVLSALGHKRFFYPSHILSSGTNNILSAMERNGVSRLVCETALGIGSSAGRMGLYYTLFVIPVILPFYFWDKTRQERLIAESAADWIIVRPAVLTNGKQREKYRHGLTVGSFLTTARISRADVASFMLDQLTSNNYLRTACGICH